MEDPSLDVVGREAARGEIKAARFFGFMEEKQLQVSRLRSLRDLRSKWQVFWFDVQTGTTSLTWTTESPE